MLEIDALVGQMHGLAAEIARSAHRVAAAREAACEQLGRAASLSTLRQAALGLGRHVALPAAEGMLSVFPAPPPPDYAVLATDGSQVPPDYHHVAPWFAVNAAAVVFRYGVPGRPSHSRRIAARLLPPRVGAEPVGELDPDQDPAADARASVEGVSGPVEVERLVSELEHARAILEEEEGALPEPAEARSRGAPSTRGTVVLLDGPLVQWRMVQALRDDRDRQRITRAFRALLGSARERAVPVAGYISRSRATEWATLVRISCCPQVAARGSVCPRCRETLFRASASIRSNPAPSHHAALDGVRDLALADALVPESSPGARTAVLELRSDAWQELVGADDSAGFFYLRTGPTARGGELARVETPCWVWQSPPLLERLHAVLAHQSALGRGYPLALAEAHEAAVVRGPDRQEFYRLVERTLERHGFPAPSPSAKAAAKRRPMA